ncbi:MAG: hypothetical protein D6730_03975 [Bacteroidetes bacterium]|nr:MAG: hypothetical protein D6730_03975 [Bacteroidota bacterium]
MFISSPYPHSFIPDGQDTDWPDKMYHDEKSGLNYAVLHDQGYVYVFLEAEAPHTQLKMLVTGMKLWVVPGGGKQKEKGIYFPVGPPTPPPASLEYINLSELDLLALQRNSLEKMSQLQWIGVNGKGTTAWKNLRQQQELAVRIGFDRQGRLLYEARLPYGSFLGIQRGQPFGLGVETGSFGRPTELGDLAARPGQGESYGAQRRVMALAELTTPTTLWVKKIRPAGP